MKMDSKYLLRTFLTIFLLEISNYYVGSQNVISIDFGTTYIKVAAVKPGKPIEIVLDGESNRKAFNSIGFKDGYLVYGEGTKNLYKKLPGAVLFDTERLLGESYSSETAKNYRERYPHVNMLEDPETGGILIQPSNYDQNFTIPEILALKLHHIRLYSKLFLNQPVSNVFIVVPPNVRHSRIEAIKSAIEITKMNLIGISDSSRSVITHYAISRKSFLNETPRTVMVIDIGSHTTVGTIARVSVENDHAKNQTYPSYNITGIGVVERGAHTLETCICNILLEEFKKKNSISEDIMKIPKVESNFYKEALNVKHLLTANKEVLVNIEDAYKDYSFQSMLKRDVFEERCHPIFDEITDIVKITLQSANLASDALDEVVLTGGGSFIPKLQLLISQKAERDVTKVINSDDSVALGSSFISARESQFFKVSKMTVKDGVYFPIQVDYETKVIQNDNIHINQSRDLLYSHMAKLSGKKVLNLKNRTDDFKIVISYANNPDLGLNEKELPIMAVNVAGVRDVVESQPPFDSSHVSAHFNFDNYQTLTISKLVIHFDRSNATGLLSRMGQAITGFFKTEPSQNEVDQANNTVAENIDTSQANNDSNTTLVLNETNSTLPNKTEVSVKGPSSVNLSYTVEFLFFNPLSSQEKNQSKIKLQAIFKKERQKREDSKARSDLESFIYSVEDSISEKVYEELASPEEYQNFQKLVSDNKEWLSENQGSADAAQIKPRLMELGDKISLFNERASEQNKLVKAVEEFKETVNYSVNFVNTMLSSPQNNVTFNISMAESILNYVNQSHSWIGEKIKQQLELKPYDEPAITSRVITDRSNTIREMTLELLRNLQSLLEDKKKTEKIKKEKKPTVDPVDVPETNATTTTTPAPDSASPKDEEPIDVEDKKIDL